jgi:type IV secretory pathway ATPase VirB11/archaellum biosynthesis ATPase
MNILLLELEKLKNRLSLKVNQFRRVFEYPYVGLLKNGVIEKGDVTISYKILTQSTLLLGKQEYAGLRRVWNNLISIPDTQIQIRIEDDYILSISAKNRSILKNAIEEVKRQFRANRIELDLHTEYIHPDIMSDNLVGNYLSFNNSNKQVFSRYYYASYIPTKDRTLDDLIMVVKECGGAIILKYRPLDKASYLKKLDKISGNLGISEEKSITQNLATEEALGRGLENVGSQILDPNSYPVSVEVFVRFNAISVKKLNTICEANLVKLSQYKLDSMWGEQLATELYCNPFCYSLVKRNVSIENWASEISCTMPISFKTMFLRGEIEISKSHFSPIALTEAKSMFIIGQTRMGKTYLAKKIIKKLIENNYTIHVIDRKLSFDDPKYDYSDVEGIIRYKVEKNDTAEIVRIITNIRKQKEEECKIGGEIPQSLIVIEESHKFISEKEVVDLLADTAKDGSKFNLGVLFITQSFRDFRKLVDSGVIAQINIRFFFKLEEGETRELCNEEFELSEEAISCISQLTEGECISQIRNINKIYNTLDYVKVS